MRFTYTDFYNAHYRAINLCNSQGVPQSDPNIDADFNLHLGARYQLILAKMNNYKTVKPYSLTTSNNTQIYPFPPGLVTIEGGFITVGSVNFPLRPIESRYNWLQLNAIMIQASALPQFFFIEQDSFQIWPTPQAAYTGTIYYHFRDRNLSVPDFNGGTITLTLNSNIVANASAVFTKAMVGRWITVTDPTVYGQGYWFRITGYSDTQHLTLGTFNGQPTVWPYATTTPASYKIGESPELPEEMHTILPAGTAADYYGFMRKDPAAMAYYSNLFYTGEPGNADRSFENKKIVGGLIGGINTYRDRDSRTVIRRRPKMNPLQYKVFATTLS